MRRDWACRGLEARHGSKDDLAWTEPHKHRAAFTFRESHIFSSLFDHFTFVSEAQADYSNTTATDHGQTNISLTATVPVFVFGRHRF